MQGSKYSVRQEGQRLRQGQGHMDFGGHGKELRFRFLSRCSGGESVANQQSGFQQRKSEMVL